MTKWLGSLAEGTDRSVPKDSFMNVLRLFMTVSKDADVNVFMNSEEGQQLRQLEAGEYVEVLEGPGKEDTVKRVRARATKDGLEGWVAYSCGDGSPLLERDRATFKVVKETVLTDVFKLEESKSSKKLKEGELVDVLEWPRKEEDSGLERLRCRVVSDGAIGWATTKGNAGAVFLELVASVAAA